METKLSKSQELFTRWFVNPLITLESLPNGDGSFIALATSCFLYERYARACIKRSGKKGNRSSLIQQFSHDFGTNKKTAEAFWDIIRDGILHQGMPKQSNRGINDSPGYIFHHSFSVPVELVIWGNEPVLKIQPWRLMWKVIELCQADHELLVENNGFPFPNIT